jgi:B12-binding domain/radical SAM domain protein
VKNIQPTRRFPLVFYYHRFNRYSFNALAATLDSRPELRGWPVSLPKTEEEFLPAVDSALARHDHAGVAFSLLTRQCGEMQCLVRKLRSRYGPRVIILAGGPHATAYARDVVLSGADIVFRGEAEESFPNVLHRLSCGRPYADIEGIAFRLEEEVVVTPRTGPVDINAYPSFAPLRGMFGPIEITRGCPFACSFCQTSHIFGVRPRHRTIDRIVNQAATLRSRGRRVVRLLSPNAFSYGSIDGKQLNLPAMDEMLAALRETITPAGRIIYGYFPSEVRPEHVNRDTMELVRKYADNDEIVIGAQSGSERMLEACHRSHSVGDVLAAVSLARKFGYKVIVDFIVGLPGEQQQDVKDTVSVLHQLWRMGARIHVHPFAPLPQTAWAAQHPGAIAPEIRHILADMKTKRAIYGDC